MQRERNPLSQKPINGRSLNGVCYGNLHMPHFLHSMIVKSHTHTRSIRAQKLMSYCKQNSKSRNGTTCWTLWVLLSSNHDRILNTKLSNNHPELASGSCLSTCILNSASIRYSDPAGGKQDPVVEASGCVYRKRLKALLSV